jgi:hypothetical protein
VWPKTGFSLQGILQKSGVSWAKPRVALQLCSEQQAL